jgi:deazaflavin-dependent oxidoreductase (nitroreductase family)
MSPELEAALRRLDLIYIQHQGRKSGRRYQTEVSFAYEEGCVYLLAHDGDSAGPDWLRNVRHAGEATFFVGTRLVRADFELLDPSWVKRIEDLFRARYGAETVRRWYENTPRLPLRLCSLEAVDESLNRQGLR